MPLFNYLKEIELPNKKIEPLGDITKSFLENHISTLWGAIEYVYKLPYGRTKNREDYLQILNEKKGACSGKHGLIATLSEELSIPLKLTLSIFLLTTKNTPKIAPILECYRLEAIPEAHCYLKYNNYRLDITFPNSSEFSFNIASEQEINITPEQIGALKVEKHRAFIKEWIKDKADLNFDLIWTAREQWIKELSQS